MNKKLSWRLNSLQWPAVELLKNGSLSKAIVMELSLKKHLMHWIGCCSQMDIVLRICEAFTEFDFFS